MEYIKLCWIDEQKKSCSCFDDAIIHIKTDKTTAFEKFLIKWEVGIIEAAQKVLGKLIIFTA